MSNVKVEFTFKSIIENQLNIIFKWKIIIRTNVIFILFGNVEYTYNIRLKKKSFYKATFTLFLLPFLSVAYYVLLTWVCLRRSIILVSIKQFLELGWVDFW